MHHVPVMLEEVVRLLEHHTIHTFFDGTCGGGGHAHAILQHHPEIKEYVACDQDPEALRYSREKLQQFLDRTKERLCVMLYGQ